MEDTIAAISTALGVGAISIIRISGEKSLEIANKIGKEVKAVDNAVQRIKKKIEKILK